MNLKKIILTDVYLEPGITYEDFYSYGMHVELQNRVDNVYTEDGNMLDKYKDYQLIIRTSPSTKDLLELSKNLKNPLFVTKDYIICNRMFTKLKDYKAIEFFVYVSYMKIINSEDPLKEYFNELKTVAAIILKELNFNSENIEKIVKAIS